METIYKTQITTQRHRTLGTCEPNDFGTLELLKLDKEDKRLMVSFKDYKGRKVEYIAYAGLAYVSLNPRMAHFSKDEESEWYDYQGKFTTKRALAYVLELRKRLRETFSNAQSKSFILIGRTLYEEYSNVHAVSVTVDSNLPFGKWLSIDFESHGGKQEYSLKKEEYERIFKKSKKRVEEAQKEYGGEFHMSYPKDIKWGKDFLK